MKYKVKLEKYINFSLISNCIIFNTLAGCGGNKKGGKGCCGSGKEDKDPIIINNEQQGTPGDKNNQEQKDKEEQEKKEKEDKENADKLAKENAEKLALENKKDGLIAEYKKLKADFDNLNKVVTKFFEINGFNITLTENEINSCDKNTIDSVEKKLNTDKTNFNNNLQTQFGVLKAKYTEINNKKFNASGYNTTKIENIIKKDKVTVDEFINLNNELVTYDAFVTNGFDGYKKTILDNYKNQEGFKLKFELAKVIDNSFDNNFETLYKNVNDSKEFSDCQTKANELNSKNTLADNIINGKKTELDNNIKTKKDEYQKIFSDYLLDQVKIEPKNFDDLNTNNFSKPDDLNTINTKLQELDNENKNITTNFKDFFVKECIKKIDTIVGVFDKLDFYVEKVYQLLLNLFEKNLLDKNFLMPTKLFDEINKCFEDHFKNNLIEKSDKTTYLKFYKVTDIDNKKTTYKNTTYKNTIHLYICKSGYFKCLSVSKVTNYDVINIGNCSLCYRANIEKGDLEGNINLNYDNLLSDESKDKSHILFYVKKSDYYLLFFCESKDKTLSNLLDYNYKNGYNKITELYILKNSDNVESLSDFFYSYKYLTTLDLSKLNTQNVTNMSTMFENCNSLVTLDLSKLDTKNVTKMSGMFKDCNALTTLDLSNFKTDKVTDMSNMFKGCNALKTLTVQRDMKEKIDKENLLDGLTVNVTEV